MTFLDEDPSVDDGTGHVVGFVVLSLVSTWCTVHSLYLGHTQSHYRPIFSVRHLFPFLNLVEICENATLAALYSGKTNMPTAWKYILFAAQATVAPILLVGTFELTYIVHKTRSVNFCGMYFDEGRLRRNVTPMRTFLLRNLMRALAICILALGLVVNFEVWGDNDKDSLAGRAGWYTFVTMDTHTDRPWDDERWLLFCSLLPIAVVCLCCFYLSLILWRYGTESSMVVHSSVCNPWFGPFFGNLALAGSQIFSAKWFPVTSNAGTLILMITLLLLMSEVDKDMMIASEIDLFLKEVARKGDAIRAVVVSSAEEASSATERKEEEEAEEPATEEEGDDGGGYHHGMAPLEIETF